MDISVGIVDLCENIICEEAFKICESDIAFEKIKTIIDNKCEKLIELMSGKIKNNLLNKKIELSSGIVDSKVLIAASLAIHNYFEE